MIMHGEQMHQEAEKIVWSMASDSTNLRDRSPVGPGAAGDSLGTLPPAAIQSEHIAIHFRFTVQGARVS